MIDLIARDEVIAAAQRIFQAPLELPLRLSSASFRKDHELNLDATFRRGCGHHLYARAFHAEEVCNIHNKTRSEALFPHVEVQQRDARGDCAGLALQLLHQLCDLLLGGRDTGHGRVGTRAGVCRRR